MKLFRAKGWKVVPFAMQHKENLVDPFSEYFVEEIEFGQSYGPVETIVKAGKVIYSLEAREKLNRLLDKPQPHISHLHNIYHHISPSILSVFKERDIPVVMTMHDLKIACPAYKMLTHDGVCERCKGGKLSNVIRHRCIKGSLAASTLVYAEAVVHSKLDSYMKGLDRLIAPSRFIMEKMAEWGIPRERMTYIPNAIPNSPVSSRSSADRFIYIGRLAEEKGLVTLIRAIAATRLKLTVVGTGPEEEKLKLLAQQISAGVEFVGYKKPVEAMALLRASRALVLPSEWYENAPISILEAYREGIPVIGAAIGGITEMVRDGCTGFTFTSGSVAELSDALLSCADMSTQELDIMGGRAREVFESEYSQEVQYEALTSLYQELGVVNP